MATISVWKEPVRAVATSNLSTTTPPPFTLDGVNIQSGDRILLTNQTTISQNGIWVVGSPWSRGETTGVDLGLQVAVQQGTKYAKTRWRLTGPLSGVTQDTTDQQFGRDEPVANISHFGAKGDGGTNDQPAIMAAIASGAGTIYFPPGNYALGAAITVSGAIDRKFIGAGPNATQLQLLGNFSAFEFTGVCSRVRIQGIWIGSAVARTAGYGISVVGTPSDNFDIEDVVLQNVPRPLRFDGVHQSRLKNVRFVETVTAGLLGPCLYMVGCVSWRISDLMKIVTGVTSSVDCVQLDSDCDTILCEGVEVGQTSGNGFALTNLLGAGHTGPRLTRLSHCWAEECLRGFQIQAGRDVRLRGCHAAINTKDGYVVVGGDSVTLEDCLAYLNENHGFVVQGGTGVNIANCTASENSQAAGQSNVYDGCLVDANVQGVRLVGNRFGDFISAAPNRQKYGIEIHATRVSRNRDVRTARGSQNAGYVNFAAASSRRLRPRDPVHATYRPRLPDKLVDANVERLGQLL